MDSSAGGGHGFDTKSVRARLCLSQGLLASIASGPKLGKHVQMFGFKPRQPRTIADVIKQKKRFVFTCLSCKTITSKEPNDLFFKPNMELTILENVSVCPKCRASNFPGFAQRLFLTVERQKSYFGQHPTIRG